MCLLGDKVSSGSWGARNLLSDARGVRFGTSHYLVCLHHWVVLGWCQQWRQGKSVQFAPVWSAVLALPTPPPLRFRGPTRLQGSGAWVSENQRVGRCHSDGAPGGCHRRQHQRSRHAEASSPASSFRQTMGVLHALGVQSFKRCVCVCVCLCVFYFSDASFKTFDLIFEFSIGASKIKK